MEIIETSLPEAWTDLNMDWSDPDPGDVSYALAMREALLERAILVGRPLHGNVFTIMPQRPLLADTMTSLRTAVYELAPHFVNLDFDDYKNDLSDFPKMWTSGDLITEERNIAEFPGRGAISDQWKPWFQAMRKAINKLTCIKFSGITGTTLSRSGATHDPPFSEAISTALNNALKGDPSRGSFNSFPQRFYAWSGNTDYKYDKETGEHGYCGYAQSHSIVIQRAQKPHPTAECDLIFKYYVAKPQGPVSYSSELQRSVFSSGSTGIAEGVGTIVTHWSNDQELDIKLGNANDIPRNAAVPSSYWGQNQTIRRSTKTGYEGIAYCILDFGVEHGFRFRD